MGKQLQSWFKQLKNWCYHNNECWPPFSTGMIMLFIVIPQSAWFIIKQFRWSKSLTKGRILPCMRSVIVWSNLGNSVAVFALKQASLTSGPSVYHAVWTGDSKKSKSPIDMTASPRNSISLLTRSRSMTLTTRRESFKATSSRGNANFSLKTGFCGLLDGEVCLIPTSSRSGYRDIYNRKETLV